MRRNIELSKSIVSRIFSNKIMTLTGSDDPEPFQAAFTGLLPEPIRIPHSHCLAPEIITFPFPGLELFSKRLNIPLAEDPGIVALKTFQQLLKIHNPAALSGAHELAVRAVLPFSRMPYSSGTNHVQVNIKQTAPEMFAVLNPCRMKPACPKCSFSSPLPIMPLANPPVDETQPFRDLTAFPRCDQKMHMVACILRTVEILI